MSSINESLRLQIEEAKKKLELARQQEFLADPDFIDIAIQKTNIAMSELNLLYKQAKLQGLSLAK